MEELLKRYGVAYIKDAPMSEYTTFRCGGRAELLAFPKTEEEALFCYNAGARFMGRGSNILVRDGGLPGLTALFSEGFSDISVTDGSITAGAGAPLSAVVSAGFAAGRTGAEGLYGIPGSVGGAVMMNAGAYGCEVAQFLTSVRAVVGGRIEDIPAGEIEMGYRSSSLTKLNAAVLSATFLLPSGDVENGRERAAELMARRREKQPLKYPSAGSVFKRPEGHFAGALIEAAGLKGYAIGGARVSEKHAGFIVNTGGATATEVEALIEYVRRRVYESSGVTLECEVRILGERL